jgi:hypothetical protein
MWFELSMVANQSGQIQRILNRAPLRVYENFHPYLVVVLDRDPHSGEQLTSDLRLETIHDPLRTETPSESVNADSDE